MKPITNQPSHIKPLTEVERHRILVEWNDTAADYPKDKCIHQLFEQQAARTPDAVAVIFDDSESRRPQDEAFAGSQSLTYRELNERANQLGHHLQSLGVGPETLVGIMVERSPTMVVGLLGILKAGGAYVPLDPAYPQERLAFMLQDASLSVLLTQEHLRESLGVTLALTDTPHEQTIVCLDSDWSQIARLSHHNPVRQVESNNLAYVLYTSGSTGQPKGVGMQHDGLVNLIQWQGKQTHNSAPRTVQFAPISFDVSFQESFSTWHSGGTLFILTENQRRNPQSLRAYLQRHRIERLFLPFVALQQLALDSRSLSPYLRTVITAGEQLQITRSIAAMFKALPDCTLSNHYGPTESHVVTAFDLPDSVDQWALLPPIGRPIANAQIYILDKNLSPVSAGIAGELYIGGIQVARGYLNRPALTAERFFTNPFGEGRLYKTGDLARWLPDGNIEFLGRMDHQVKIRGFRIEPGEVEATLSSHSAVRQAVVVVREDQPGDKRLTAYVVSVDDATESDDLTQATVGRKLRSYLHSKLPDYMIPSAFVLLDALLLTPSGKVDRKGLPAPVTFAQDREYIGPRNEIERQLAAIWQETLNLDQVGVHDDFFELGGDSIKGALVVNRLQECFGGLFHVVMLFEASTVADCAAYLQREYPELFLDSTQQAQVTAGVAPAAITLAQVTQLRNLLPVLSSRSEHKRAKNRPAIFVLSPPRSGSTLLRVMLAGHPQIFAPPELYLLSYNTLLERKAAFSGPHAFWGEGTIHALRQIGRSNTEVAQHLMEQLEQQGLTTPEFFHWLQERLGKQIIVDKTATYAFDLETLKRAEMDFDQPLYIHLLRHPYGMIRSFEEAKLDQILYSLIPTLRSADRTLFSRRELAELLWLISHQNIRQFLEGVPAARHHRVYFEDLVLMPEVAIKNLCRFLGLDFHAQMLQPYAEKKQRMTDALHAGARMLGDVKFHDHKQINSAVADQWKTHYAKRADFLSEMTWQVAERFGYDETIASSQAAWDEESEALRLPSEREEFRI